MRFGFVGLGQMGAPMAEHLAGPDLIVYDTRPEAMTPLVEKGARPAAGVAEVASASLISIMVRDDAEVTEVVGALLPAAAPGTVIAIHSTIRADTAVTLDAQAEPYGIDIVDAPVRLGRIVRHSDAVTGGPGAIMIRRTTAPLDSEDPLQGTMRHVLALGEKDLSLALELAADLGVDTPLARLAYQRLAADLGLPQEEPSDR